MQTSSNVVMMRDFAPEVLPADNYRTIKDCRERSVERISTSVGSMLDKVEEVLWSLAEKAEERADRDLYYKGKDAFRPNKAPLAQQFRLNLITAFEQKSKGLPIVGRVEEDADDGELQLSLVDDDDLNESLKFNELAARLRTQCEIDLTALNQRLAVVLGVPNLDDKDNPIGPTLVCDAFKSACNEVKIGFKVRMVLLNLFEVHVAPDLTTLYHDLNDLMSERGILPKLRAGAHRKTVSGAGPVTGPQVVQTSPAPQAASGVGAHGEPDFFSMLQGLMTMGQTAFAAGSQSAAGTGSAPGMPAQTGAELIGSLTRMQRGDTSLGGSPAFQAAMLSPGANNVLHELKASAMGGGFGQVDTMTLDIVAMLFDQIFDDRNIPSALKALIGRLQIPMLKVAVLDKKFFSKKHHPARRVLDTLGDFGLGLGEDFGPSSPLYVRLDEIVQRLLDDFDDNVEIFEKLIEELNQVIGEEAKRAEEEANKSAKRIANTERLAIARVLAQNEIKQRAEEKRLPQVIQDFLASHWMKLLLLTYARGGKESAAWKSAIESMDILIWSVEAKQSADERRRLATVLPGLLKRLDAGMKIAATAAPDRDSFFGKLMRCHTKVIEGSMPVTKLPPASPKPAPVASPVEPTLKQIVESTTAASTIPHPVDSEIEEKLNQWNDERLPASPLDMGEVTHETEEVELDLPEEIDDAEAGARVLSAFSEAEIELATAPPTFDNTVTIKNPFGDGEIQVEEVDFGGALPTISNTANAVAEPKPVLPPVGGTSVHADASGLKEGAWVEIRRADDSTVQARLAYISPMRNTYLFTNRQGTKVAELSLYELAREVRSGNINVIEEVPLFDRAMGSLVGTLRKNAPVH
jgi:ElaB/YqjD/DUF883 family membrane-anchored ribosome-binding protein